MQARPAARIFVEAGLGAGARVALSPDETHRLRTVLRLQPGDRIALFNGSDGEWRAEIAAMDRRSCVVVVAEQMRTQEDESDLWLVFAPIKRARLDFLIEKATELGVSALLPVVTAHTVVARVNLDHVRATARAAAEQSERLTLPALHAVQSLAQLAASWPAERHLILCDETGAAPPVAAALAMLAPGPRAVLVGPEGGFAQSELDALRKLPFVCPVGLGPRVLRSDTAALAGLAVAQAIGGDWSAVRRRRFRTGVASSP
jgi:16S rRNA (uracil1498-N3)-methyltransferase